MRVGIPCTHKQYRQQRHASGSHHHASTATEVAAPVRLMVTTRTHYRCATAQAPCHSRLQPALGREEAAIGREEAATSQCPNYDGSRVPAWAQPRVTFLSCGVGSHTSPTTTWAARSSGRPNHPCRHPLCTALAGGPPWRCSSLRSLALLASITQLCTQSRDVQRLG